MEAVLRDMEQRQAQLEAAIEQGKAQLNALMGRKAELDLVIATLRTASVEPSKDGKEEKPIPSERQTEKADSK